VQGFSLSLSLSPFSAFGYISYRRDVEWGGKRYTAMRTAAAAAIISARSRQWQRGKLRVGGTAVETRREREGGREEKKKERCKCMRVYEREREREREREKERGVNPLSLFPLHILYNCDMAAPKRAEVLMAPTRVHDDSIEIAIVRYGRKEKEMEGREQESRPFALCLAWNLCLSALDITLLRERLCCW
jgi:hypothetical protein